MQGALHHSLSLTNICSPLQCAATSLRAAFVRSSLKFRVVCVSMPCKDRALAGQHRPSRPHGNSHFAKAVGREVSCEPRGGTETLQDSAMASASARTRNQQLRPELRQVL